MESTINIRPATFDDIRRVPLDPQYEFQPPEEVFHDLGQFHTHSRAVEKNGEMIAVFGVTPIWEGVGHCYGYVTKDAPHYKKTLIIVGREMVAIAADGFGFWRLQATVDTRFQRGINYLLALGFSVDGLLPRFGPDRADHVMMSRLIDG